MREEHFILQQMLNMRSEIDLSGLVKPAEGPVFANPTVRPRYDAVLPPDGNRMPAEKSPFNYRSRIPNHDLTRTMPAESDVERGSAHLLKTNKSVIELRAQWPTVEFVGRDGKTHDHTFDYWARLKNGTRVALAVKPLEKILSQDLIDTLRRIEKAGVTHFADRISWIDEQYATEADDANARWILWSRIRRNEDECEVARRLIENVTNVVRFWDLVRIAPIPAYRRIAVWNLIDDGLLHPVAPGRISDASFLRPAN